MQRLAWLAAIGGLWLAACSPQVASPTATAPESTRAPTVTPQPLPTGGAAGPAAPTATPEEISTDRILQVQSDDWARGPVDARVTIIEWGDFQ